MRKAKLTAAVLFASSACLMASAALADETTIIHEHREVQPAADQATQTHATSETTTAATAPAPAVRRVTTHRVVRHTIVRHTVVRHAVRRHVVAKAALPEAVDASATVRRTEQSATQTNASPTVVDRRTVIHRDDEGNVERHTTVLRQDSQGMTAVDHRSTSGPDQ